MVGADWVITGEGRSDEQTLHGKAPYVVSQRARRAGVPTTLLSGAVDIESSAKLNEHFHGCFSLAPGPIDLETALSQADLLLGNAAEQVARVWAVRRQLESSIA
jgi:glycerate kinase